MATLASLKYENGLLERLIVNVEYDGKNSKEITLIRMNNIGQILQPDTLPILVYLFRGSRETEYCQDWYYFDEENKCSSHKCVISRAAGNNTKIDADIGHLAEEKEFLEYAQKAGQSKDARFSTSKIYKLITTILETP